jgi:hypothetical protein
VGGGDAAAWLRRRRRHHSVVFADAGLPEGVTRLLRDTQPHAARVALVSGDAHASPDAGEASLRIDEPDIARAVHALVRRLGLRVA